HERRRHYGENPGGESFGTDISDPHSSYSRQTHSKHASFEQNLSVDIADASYLTPMGPGPQSQLVIPPPSQLSPHMGNHIGSQQTAYGSQQSGYGSQQSAYMVNHVNFNLQPGPQMVM
ncbi:hypothetical protein OSTOST_19953, partial [Ostertagia ostertagi]